MDRLLARRTGASTLVVLASSLAGASALDLATALRIADRNAFAIGMASARVDAAEGRRTATLAGILPNLRLEAGAGATTDPLGAFASRLGQRDVTMASFDPRLLNDPDAVPGFTAGAVAEVPLVNIDAWRGRAEASRALDASRRAERLERVRVHAQVVQAWYGVGLARAAVDAWESGLAVARSYERRARAGRASETVVPSDVLRAQVEVSSIEANLSKARVDVLLAERRLALLMGSDSLTGTVPYLETIPDEIAPSISEALELDVAKLQAKAARAGLQAARAGHLPRVNGMARLDWKERDGLFGEDPSWTVGVVASWNVMGGFGTIGKSREAYGMAREAEIGVAALAARIAMEHAAQRARLDASREQLASKTAALRQAEEAHRVVARRYEEGVATLSERIEAGSLETRIRLEMASLRQEIVAALAEIALLEGRDPAELAGSASAITTGNDNMEEAR